MTHRNFPPDPGPVVASYCTTFLKKEMLHIYRQVTGLKDFTTFVMTKSRENAEVFPFDDVEVLPRPRINFLLRFHKKYLARMEPVFYRGEYDQLSGVLSRRSADLIHVYFGHTGVHLLPFLKNWPKPSVVSFHGMDIMLRNEEPGYNDRLKELLQTLPMVLARSESLAVRLVALGCDRSKIRINRTGIPMDQFPASVRKAPADGRWIFVQASRFIEKKGIFDTMEAFATFRKVHAVARLVLAGEGPLQQKIEHRAKSLGIHNSLDFAGFLERDALNALFQRAHLFLHPSVTTPAGDQEGVPNSMLEAMASGLPVVATQHGGIPEAVVDGEDGFLVPEGCPELLAERLETITSNPELHARMSVSAAFHAREKFEQARSIAALESFYSELLSKDQ
ncbi:MAG: glycosyltransferase [Terrimicrobiaceae bacterium]